jgi:hypothetical protein
LAAWRTSGQEAWFFVDSVDEATVAMLSITAFTSFFETVVNSEIASINSDLVIFVIVVPRLKWTGLRADQSPECKRFASGIGGKADVAQSGREVAV